MAVEAEGAPVKPPHHDQTPVLLASYWGKADPKMAACGPDHHTVLGHSLDVAACAFVLIARNPTALAQLANASRLAGEAVAPTLAAVCALHDIGKLDTRFQRKAPHVADVLRPHTRSVETMAYDHGTEGFRQIEDDDDARDLIHSILGPSALPLLRAVCGHHGVFPLRDEPASSRVRLPGSVRREDAAARRIFQEHIATFFRSLGAALPWAHEVDGALVQRLGGLCAVADWIGSNVDFFPYASGLIQDVEEYWSRTCQRAERACAESGLLRTAPKRVRFGDLFPGYTPRDVQRLTERTPDDLPALVVVEAEMGKGKTEAALSLASRFLANGLADGLTVALPTMATSNAMFGRVEDMVARLFGSGAVQLALAHGRASRHSGFDALVKRSLRALDPEAPEATVMCARWLLSKKRILLAQIGVGTIDQALQAALVVRHQFVRMFGLSRNVVIIDEVHAYDAYMEVLLEHLLGWLGALHVPVVLLSATLPSERRAALARAWRVGANPEHSQDEGATELEDLETAKSSTYPLVSVTTRAGTTVLAGDELPDARTVIVEHAPRKGSEAEHVEAVTSQLLRAARGGARVVWIRNTVREAQRAFGALADRATDVEHTLFHARFRGVDRRRIERSVLDRFGKSAPPGGRILVATQVVEQSLDLDFDRMHTDLAPIDLLFQRAGRLHRHRRQRPPNFDSPRLVVHSPSDAEVEALRFGPSRFVYDAGTLWIANRAVRSREALRLPADIRTLVEESYHPTSRVSLLALGGPELLAAEQKRHDELEAKRTKAKQCCIPPTTVDPDGGSAMDDDEDAVQAFTRDGVSATILPFWWDGEQGRALDAGRTEPAWHLDAERHDAWQLASELLDQTLSLPARGDVEGVAVRSDDMAWRAWRRRFARFAEESGLGRRVVPLPMIAEIDSARGWLRMGRKRRRVLYTRTLGLLIPSEKNEEQAR